MGGEHLRAGRVDRVHKEACEVSRKSAARRALMTVKNGFSREMWAAARLQWIDRGGDI